MNSVLLIAFSIIIFIVAYITYGGWLVKKWGIDPTRKTPANTMSDGVDYVPAKAPVLLGHHFASIAGAGPIVGPIVAAMFGWVPVLLWIVVGSVFFGGVHDMGALFASVRHNGRSIGEVIGEKMGAKGKKLFASIQSCIIILLGYVFIASVTPVWILLQPRDYLNSFLLYAMLAGGIVGLLFLRPEIQLPAFTSFKVGTNYMFPILFITIACGAISGFHSLVGSGTTSKQLDNESDIRLIGYGSMLIEGVLATLAIITAAYLTSTKLADLSSAGGALNVFADGIGTFMSAIGIPFIIAKNFVTLAIAAFALTTLDTATRLARFILQEFFMVDTQKSNTTKTAVNIMTNKYFSTLVTVVLSGALAFKGYQLIWPIFGSANQLLAALALLSLAVWLKQTGRSYKMAIYPMLFMFAVTLTALVLLIMANLANPVILIFAVILFILAIILIIESQKAFKVTEIQEDIK